jgi:hypothetical protein
VTKDRCGIQASEVTAELLLAGEDAQPDKEGNDNL